MINIDRTFKKILQKWGHDILLQRVLENGNHSDRLERVTVRAVGQSGKVNVNATEEVDEGIIVDHESVYYMEGRISPKEGDRIYEGYSTKVHTDNTIYVIDAVTPVRGRFGEITYWIVGATREK